jgi:hypothetical protein
MEIFLFLDQGAISVQKYRSVHGGGASRKDAEAQRGKTHGRTLAAGRQRQQLCE